MSKTHRSALSLMEEGVISGLFLRSANTTGIACEGNLRYVMGTGFVMRDAVGKISLGGSGVFLQGANTTTPSVTGQFGYVSGLGLVGKTQDGLIAFAPRTTTVIASLNDGSPVIGDCTVPAGAGFVNVTAASAANGIVFLPAPVVGNEVILKVGDTGYELRSSDSTTIMINGGSGAAVESAIAARTMTKCICVDSDSWFCWDIPSGAVLAVTES